MAKKLVTVRLSEKGKVAIPEKLRNELGLKAGDNFVVVGKDDTILLKLVRIPSSEKVDELLAMADGDGKVDGKAVPKKRTRKIIDKVSKENG